MPQGPGIRGICHQDRGHTDRYPCSRRDVQGIRHRGIQEGCRTLGQEGRDGCRYIHREDEGSDRPKDMQMHNGPHHQGRDRKGRAVQIRRGDDRGGPLSEEGVRCGIQTEDAHRRYRSTRGSMAPQGGGDTEHRTDPSGEL